MNNFRVPILLVLWMKLSGSVSTRTTLLQNTIETSTYDYFYQDISTLGINVTARTSLVFEVRACAEAYLGLFTKFPFFFDGMTMHEFLIGGSNNTVSIIRKGMNGTDLSQYQGPVIDCDNDKAFWVSWAYGLIQLGSGYDVGINILTEVNESSPNVHYFGVTSGDGYHANWTFEKEIFCTQDNKIINSTGLLIQQSGFMANDDIEYYGCGQLTLTSGNLARTCQQNGVWSGSEPKCEVVCPLSIPAINSSGLLFIMSGHDLGSVLYYKCRHNGSLYSGDLERTCLQNQTWNGTEPKCDMCMSHPCVHGSCTDQISGYKCDCNTGYTGVQCDQMIHSTSVTTDAFSTYYMTTNMLKHFGSFKVLTTTKHYQHFFLLNGTSETSILQMVYNMIEKQKDNHTTVTLNSVSVAMENLAVKKLKKNFSTQYGDVIFSHPIEIKYALNFTNVSLFVLSSSLNLYTPNTTAINSGAVSVGLYDNNTQIIQDDLNVTATISVTLGSWFAKNTTFEPMEQLLSNHHEYILVTELNKGNTFLIEMILQKDNCSVYMKFGECDPKKDYDMVVKTGNGNTINGRISVVSYNGHINILIIKERQKISDKYFTVSAQCKGVTKRKPDEQAFMYRVFGLTVKKFDRKKKIWVEKPSANITEVKHSRVYFKTSFLGTFGISAIFIPPRPIDFARIFANFSDRFLDTPYVLVLLCSILLLAICMSIYLRRMDKGDFMLWDYIPLVDNTKRELEKYLLSVHTSSRSSRTLTSNVFINIIGNDEETGMRRLDDGIRKNFKRGTSSCFLLTTDKRLGPLTEIQLWHDNSGNSPRWRINKMIISDINSNDKYVLQCDRWLSMEDGNGQCWLHLPLLPYNMVNSDRAFSDAYRYCLFDENLWVSVLFRPNFSRFTRVQRLWTLICMLFLSMVTSAMWYDTFTASSVKAISIGPFKISYKELYVGFISTVISIVPLFFIIHILRNRKLKSECTERKMEGPMSRKACLFPWWFLFISHSLIIVTIFTCGTFTFLYSLQWQTDLTLNWMASFFMGLSEGCFIIEPIKVIVVAFLLSFLCKDLTMQKVSEIPPFYKEITSSVRGSKSVISETQYPDKMDLEYPLHSVRRRLKLDRKLNMKLKTFVWYIIYLGFLGILCSHMKVTESYRERHYLKSMINPKHKPNSSSDIWKWIDSDFITSVYPRYFSNGHLLPHDLQRYIENGYSFRLGRARLRQVRVKGNCSVLFLMNAAMYDCQQSYSRDKEEKSNFCAGWKQKNTSCKHDNQLFSRAFRYSDSTDLPYFGLYGYYRSGGYFVDIGPDRTHAKETVSNLKNYGWIDSYTRAVFAEFAVYNPGTRLHSHVKIIFELSAFSDIQMNIEIYSSNLYPYIVPWDFIVLAFQLLYIPIVFVQLGRLVMGLCRTKCYFSSRLWLDALLVALSTSAIVLYILRIDETLATIERINKNTDSFISFGRVFLLDQWYRYCVSFVIFIAVLDLLKPLTFNYYLHLMRSSLLASIGQLASHVCILVILLLAFSCLLYAIEGPYLFGFRNMCTAMLSVTRIMLGVEKFNNTLSDDDSVWMKLIFMTFVMLTTIILVNLFVTILIWTFNFVNKSQNLKNLTGFDYDLNRHFWRKLNGIWMKVADMFCSASNKGRRSSSKYKAMKTFLLKIRKFEKLVMHSFDEDQDYFKWLLLNAIANENIKDRSKFIDEESLLIEEDEKRKPTDEDFLFYF